MMQLASPTICLIYGVFFPLLCRILNILICNAAVLGGPYSTTENGVEKMLATNHLGHFYLAELLKDLLIKSLPTRVAVVSSESHRYSRQGFLYIIITCKSAGVLLIIFDLMRFVHYEIFLKKFMAPFYGWRSTDSRL